MVLKDKRIFIVEDDAGGLAIASHYLQNEGARIIFIRAGEGAAKKILGDMPVDAIVMDLMLPRQITGFDVFSEIRKVPELANIPVVAVSSMDPDIAMPRAKELGFAGFIAKPVSPKITKHIESVLDGNKIWIGDSRR